MRIALLAILAVCSMVTARAAATDAAAPGGDAIEGRWLGEAGFPADRVVVGFEFRRNDKQELVACLYQPVLNVYGVPLPGAFTRDDSQRYVNADNRITLTLDGGRLEGTWSSLAFPVALRRSDTLPAEAPVADAPKGPGPRWQVKLGAPIYAAAAVRDGVAYVGSTGGVFHAVRVADGSLAWTFNAGRATYGEALVTDAHVYFACDSGLLYKLDRGTGKEVWRYDLGDAQVARVLPHTAVFEYDYHAPKPLLSGGVIYVGSGDGALHAVDAQSSRRVWRYETGGKVRVGALRVGDRIVFGSLDNKVYAVDAKSGARMARRPPRPGDDRAGVRRRQDPRRHARQRPVRARSANRRRGVARSLLGLVGRIRSGRARRNGVHRLVGPAPRERDRSARRPRRLAHRRVRQPVGETGRDRAPRLHRRRRHRAVHDASRRQRRRPRARERPHRMALARARVARRVADGLRGIARDR